MKNVITIVNNGMQQSVDLVSYFELINTGKKYLFYTLNEKVENGLIKMYAASVNAFNNDFTLDGNLTDDEWNALKMVMKTILTGGNDSNVKYLSIN